MNFSEKEIESLNSGKIKAIIRWEVPKEKEGDLVSAGEVLYRVTHIKRWTVMRIAAQRPMIDFGCDSVGGFRALFTYVYGSYAKNKNKIVWLVGLRMEKKQKTLF